MRINSCLCFIFLLVSYFFVPYRLIINTIIELVPFLSPVLLKILSFFETSKLHWIYVAFKFIKNVITIVITFSFMEFISRSSDRHFRVSKGITILQYLAYLILLIILPLCFNFLMVKWQMFIYISVPFIVSLFLRFMTDDRNSFQWLDKFVRNFLLISAAMLIFV